MNTYEFGFRLSSKEAMRTQTFVAPDYASALDKFRLSYPRAIFHYGIRMGVTHPPDRRLPREDD